MYLLNQIGEWNPQLLRELKGRLTPINIAIVTAISLIGQVIVFLYYISLLPSYEGWNRYCSTAESCFQNLKGEWVIIKELWWLDIFIALSIIGIFILLVGGTYLLVTDVANEEKKGTLDFVRMSPTKTTTIFLGKILGVPILIYALAMLAAPLHWFSGLKAGIPWALILGYYAVLVASLFCCYSLAVLYSLISSKLEGFQPWLASGGVLVLTSIVAVWVGSRHFEPGRNMVDWLLLFYPGTALHYLVKATFLAPDTVGYLDLNNLAQLYWYGKPVMGQVITGITLMLFNYALWSYWTWLGIRRRFYNPQGTVLTKRHSYWLSFSFIVMTLGLTLQEELWPNGVNHFAVLQLANLVFCWILIAMLTPQGQILQDWARYRHQQSQNKRNLLRDLCLGEKSPAVLAIAINLGITTLYIIPSVFLLVQSEARLPILAGWLLSANLALISALLVQLWLQTHNPKRAIWAIANLGVVTVIPLMGFAWLQIEPHQKPGLWLFSILPTLGTGMAGGLTIVLACLTQWLAIALLTGTMTYRLTKVGESDTKILTATK
ncbi:ABC transporter permease [Gloeocapsa sp. PCC 73106]|uniref:ABC transporter permease n=1 Tax=Gloeocapsa sp. PCC 73106 TaxID=102232 RepID=UPI0002ABBBAC|nr:ABC transporter permease [Gloeocapsa sp. PCC 73106]ELR97834.1 hypothetical protein GLO73106DRAFT_00016510 [Gloeocapsa sp. PCC 73106]